MVTLHEGPVRVRRTDVTVRTAEEERADRREAARRADVTLRVIAVTLAWLVSVSLLIGWGLANRGPNNDTNAAAALLTIVLPFVGAVIATRNRMPVLGGCYAVMTLVMVFPALGIVRSG
jgi:hypothetical protein